MCQGELPAFCKATLMILSGGRHCGKPNRSKISLYPRGHAARNLAGFIGNAVFNPSFLSHSLTCGSSFFPSPIFFSFLFLSDAVKSCSFGGARGQLVSDQRLLFFSFQHRTRQRRRPTQLHCEPESCVIFTHCPPSPPSSVHPLLCPSHTLVGNVASKRRHPQQKSQRLQSNHKTLLPQRWMYTQPGEPVHAQQDVSMSLQIPVPLMPGSMETVH